DGRFSSVVFVGLVRALDFAMVVSSAFVAHAIWLRGDPTGPSYAPGIVAVALAATVALQAIGADDMGAIRQPLRYGTRIAAAWSGVFLVVFAVGFFFKVGGDFSRGFAALWFLLGLAALVAGRGAAAAAARALVRSGRMERRAVGVGAGESGEELLRLIETDRRSDVRVLGVFDDRTDARSPDVVAGYPNLGRVEDLVEFARRTRVDLVLFSLPITAERRILEMLRALWVLPIDIRLSAHNARLRFRPRSYSYVGSVPVLDLFDRPIGDWDVVLKAAFDRIVGGLALFVLSPLLLAVAVAVKLDSKGPVFFRQRRLGFNNEVIEVWKFRSLKVEDTDHEARRQVTRDDPRVTRVGRFIRRASIDELPQLFNVVFAGDLSLVGPRPHAVRATAKDRGYEEVVDGYFARHRVKPGITGWAQVNGWRGETDTDEKLQRRVEHDLHYIENWSIPFDLYILLATPFSLLRHRDVY
ncbi:MAG: undecaprenyl-phosphate glucose phosphotransferase, partial [Hyphomicrobiales bacterium]|nr:undecaprenyl-phosphate glucose phosphotransferase [Hyphomicrobiales bacterium]